MREPWSQFWNEHGPSGQMAVELPNEAKIRTAGIVNVDFGRNVTVIEPANIYECKIGDDSFVGPFVEIQKGVRIGNRTRIQSHAFICELVEIGDDCFISHGAMFINDLFAIGGPAHGRQELWRPTKIGNRVSIGTNATILPVVICDEVVVGAGAVVTKDITQPGIYVGNPARLLRPLGQSET
jgi:acetyltransferase-like isoleucine patch superfamily enzyme